MCSILAVMKTIIGTSTGNLKVSHVVKLNEIDFSLLQTAYTLSFMLYHLSVNEDAQNKLYEEIQRIVVDPRKPLDEEILNEAHYLKKVMKEAQRLNPVSLGIGRLTTEDIVLGGYEIPKNVSYHFHMQLVHFDSWSRFIG